MQYCPRKQTACKLHACKHGEEIKGIDFDSESHELKPFLSTLTCEWYAGEMTEEEFERWKKGERFFKPANPLWNITTDKMVYTGTGKLGKILKECDDFEEK